MRSPRECQASSNGSIVEALQKKGQHEWKPGRQAGKNEKGQRTDTFATCKTLLEWEAIELGDADILHAASSLAGRRAKTMQQLANRQEFRLAHPIYG